jgi:multiple sugar transport system substrate-binding protein
MPATRRLVALLTLGGLALATACTGSPSNQAAKPGADVPSNQKVTITFWHGWSAQSEVKPVVDAIARFHKAHPNITVKQVPNVDDTKILQGIRGANGPDVVSSFTTDNVGEFCNGALIDLNPLLKGSGIDKNKVFVKTMIDYTQYKGNQCTLPLLGDAYGLYYNKTMFAKAGIKRPPHTLSELRTDAIKLTKPKGNSYAQLGIMPNYQGYETAIAHWLAQYDPTYLTPSGKSNMAADPAFADELRWHNSMINALGGYNKLENYRHSFGEEISPQNAFETGKVAMQLDGEWRAGMIKADGSKVNFGTAPMPVPDSMANRYGGGYLSGSIIGIPSSSQHQQAAWEFVKFMTTDTPSLVEFANAIHNVPSTIASLHSPDLEQSPAFKTFIKIAENPNSTTTPSSPNGGQYQVILQQYSYKYEAGKGGNLEAGLKNVDKQVNAANAQAAN